ncbi:hypothetical protein M569_13867, partial [Genlisea aurea]
SIGVLEFGIGACIVVLLMVACTLATYFCTGDGGLITPAARSVPPVTRTPAKGIDESTWTGCPRLLYSEVKARVRGSTAASCTICLADYRNADVIRRLPKCGHLFHVTCIDPWLRLHPTCPVCRTPPLTPQRSEVIPTTRP